MTNCISQSIYAASIVFFVVGAVLFLVTSLCWIRLVCKRRAKRLKVLNRPLPLAPPAMTLEVMASGAYIDLQESVNRYESVDATPGVKSLSMIPYIPRDAMHETFDGSRMPLTIAPHPPSHPPAVLSQENENVTIGSKSDAEETDMTDENGNKNKESGKVTSELKSNTAETDMADECENGNNNVEDENVRIESKCYTQETDVNDENKISNVEDSENQELECTYEKTDTLKLNREGPPTIPGRSPFKK